MATKAIKDFELENGIIFLNLSDKEAERSVDSAEFEKLRDDAVAAGDSTVTYFDPAPRIKFLKANNYPVTRENLANADLSTVER